MNFHCMMDWRLLAYTKSKRMAKKSKLIVSVYLYEFSEYDHLVQGLLMLYKWFSDQCAKWGGKMEEKKNAPVGERGTEVN